MSEVKKESCKKIPGFSVIPGFPVLYLPSTRLTMIIYKIEANDSCLMFAQISFTFTDDLQSMTYWDKWVIELVINLIFFIFIQR